MEQSIVSASKFIEGMTKTFNLGTAKVLTAVCSVLAPPSFFSDDVEGVAINDLCNMIGVNRQSKYVKAGFNNRREYQDYLDRKGPILVGERVTCRSSPEAIVTAFANDGSITVKLLPFGTEKRYKSISSGKV